MNKVLLHIMLCIGTLLTGCTSFGKLQEEEMPYIALDMTLNQTKSLISQDNLNTTESKFIVYDVHTSPSGITQQYMENQYLEYRNNQWSFTKTAGGDVIQIPWTKKGIHDFLAYNSYDAYAGKSLPMEVLYNSNKSALQQTLRIPKEGTFTINLDNQFDFLYGTVSRNVEIDGYTSLPMNFKHLFAAVSVEVRNASTENLILQSISFSNINDTGYAVIDYSAPVQYELSASSTNGLFPQTEVSNVGVGRSITLYSSLGAGNAFLIWPHSAANLADAAISITYKLGSSNNLTKSIKLYENNTVKTWIAGNKYKYLIAITDNNISFDVLRVVDWINDDVILEE